jgi:hypothetical protein
MSAGSSRERQQQCVLAAAEGGSSWGIWNGRMRQWECVELWHHGTMGAVVGVCEHGGTVCVAVVCGSGWVWQCGTAGGSARVWKCGSVCAAVGVCGTVTV